MGQSLPAPGNARVRTGLTHLWLQVSVTSELLRRFGVSGRKRSYQTLLVAARSSRRPFSFPHPSIPHSQTQPVWSMNRLAQAGSFCRAAGEFGAWGQEGAKRSRGGPFPDRPANRHSEVLYYLARPGSGWAAKANFSKNNKWILIVEQSSQAGFTAEYADISGLGSYSARVGSVERTFRNVRYLTNQVSPDVASVED